MVLDENWLVHRRHLPTEVAALVDDDSRRSERVAASLRLAFGGVGGLALLANWGSNTLEAMVFASTAFAVAFAFALVVWGLARRDRLPRGMRYVAAAVDMTFVTAFSASGLLNYSGAYETLLAPLPPVLYAMFMLLSALTGSVFVTLFAGLLAAAQRFGLLAYIVDRGLVEVSDNAVYGERAVGLSDQYTIVGFMAVVGMLLASMAFLLRKDSIRNAFDTLAKQESERVRAHYRKYLSANVADFVASQPGAMALGGSRRLATAMFVDIREFTPLTAHERPERVVEMLNLVFGELVTIVFKHGGTLDKFLGDGIMVVFGVPQEQPDAPARAVAAAMEMVSTIGRLEALKVRPDGQPLRIGVGIAHGVVIAGNVGSAQRMEYTCIGEAVNFAARLCGLCRELAQDVVVSDAVHDAVREGYTFREMPKIRVKGVAGEPTLWAVLGPKGPAGSPAA